MATRERFVVKKLTTGRSTVWRVYDAFRGSFPRDVPGLGPVVQDHGTEQAAVAERDRVAAALGATY